MARRRKRNNRTKRLKRNNRTKRLKRNNRTNKGGAVDTSVRKEKLKEWGQSLGDNINEDDWNINSDIIFPGQGEKFTIRIQDYVNHTATTPYEVEIEGPSKTRSLVQGPWRIWEIKYKIARKIRYWGTVHDFLTFQFNVKKGPPSIRDKVFLSKPRDDRFEGEVGQVNKQTAHGTSHVWFKNIGAEDFEFPTSELSVVRWWTAIHVKWCPFPGCIMQVSVVKGITKKNVDGTDSSIKWAGARGPEAEATRSRAFADEWYKEEII
jgi:hypothetical protein